MRDPELRAAEADRRQTVAQLQRHYVDGRLNEDELGDRVAQALAARTFGDLDALLRDLPAGSLPTTGAPAALPSQLAAAAPLERRAPTRGRAFRAHLTSYLAVMALLVAIWLLTTPGGYFWPVWPMLGWGAGVASHAGVGRGRCGRRDAQDADHAPDAYGTRHGALVRL